MDMPVLAVTIGLLASLVAVCLLPVCADSAEDRGDGRTEVIIPSFTQDVAAPAANLDVPGRRRPCWA